MAHGTFQISDTNPNDSTGGGGCLCSEEHDPDTHGPYVVAYATSTDSTVSPFVVVCAECMKEIAKLFNEKSDQPLRIGYAGDTPKVSNPYHGDADQGDEVLRERRIRAEQGPILVHNTPAVEPTEDEPDDEEAPGI